MRFRRAVWPLLVSLLLIGVLFTAVLPTRTFLHQRTAIAHAETQLEVLGEQNRELEARARELESDAEIERLAREQYNLVKPGEEAYVVLPPPARPEDEPAPAAERPAADADRNVVERAWDAVTGLF